MSAQRRQADSQALEGWLWRDRLGEGGDASGGQDPFMSRHSFSQRRQARRTISASALKRKIDLLIGHFGSQRSKQWFDSETFLGLARLRGMECRAPERYGRRACGLDARPPADG
jgi:hypothetical protein